VCFFELQGLVQTDQSERRNMSTEDTVVVHLDRPTAMLVDAWRHKSMFEPSRRQAVRALLRQALRQQDAAKAKEAANAVAPARAGEQAVSA
jgi:hypothetical protein